MKLGQMINHWRKDTSEHIWQLEEGLVTSSTPLYFIPPEIESNSSF